MKRFREHRTISARSDRAADCIAVRMLLYICHGSNSVLPQLPLRAFAPLAKPITPCIERGVRFAKSQSCFFTTQRHANRRYDANLIHHSTRVTQQIAKELSPSLLSLSLQPVIIIIRPSYTRFSRAPCPPNVTGTGNCLLLPCRVRRSMRGIAFYNHSHCLPPSNHKPLSLLLRKC